MYSSVSKKIDNQANSHYLQLAYYSFQGIRIVFYTGFLVRRDQIPAIHVLGCEQLIGVSLMLERRSN